MMLTHGKSNMDYQVLKEERDVLYMYQTRSLQSTL